MTPELQDSIVGSTDCPTCGSEIGYPCTSRARNTDKPLMHPHDLRVQEYNLLQLRLTSYAEAQAKRRAREREKELREQVRAQRQALLVGYRQYGVDEARQLSAWLRQNWRIFRIDEKF
jgi:hypothetical protein